MPTARPHQHVLLLLLVLTAVPAACARAADDERPAPWRVLGADGYRTPDRLLDTPGLRELVDLQVARDGGALADALADADPVMRARAAFALGSVQDTAAVGPLTAVLADADARVRADAAFALGQTPTAAGAGALLARLLVETDTAVLGVMLDALGRSGGAAELDALARAHLADARGGDPAVAAPLALAYARFGMRGVHDPLATDWLVAALATDSEIVRQNAAYYFARSPDVQPWAHRRRWLVRALEDYGFAARSAMHLLVALARLDDEDDLPVFVAWLTASPDWAIRVNAARALGRHTDSAEARAALLAALDDTSHHVRTVAATGLAGAGASLTATEAAAIIARVASFEDQAAAHGALLRAVAGAGRGDWVLERWLGLSDAALRRTGLVALVDVPGRAAFEALAAAAVGEDAALAAAAIGVLARRRAVAAGDAADDRYYDVFADALRTRDLAVSYSAAAALADSAFAPLGAGPLLQSVFLQLEAPADLEAMARIVQTLGALGDSTAVPLLREVREGTWPGLRNAAAEALASITGEPAGLPSDVPSPGRAVQWDWLAQWGSAPRLRLETERGVIVLELAVEQAPLTVNTILALTTDGRFDGVPFHRVVANFVAQGGDVERGDGWGGPGYAIRSEFTRIPYLRGTAGMASSGKDTEGSQYFITHSMQPHLDGQYTAFGTLVEGLDVLDAIREGDLVLRATATVTP